MGSGSYDLNVCKLRTFYDDVVDAWEKWKDKPTSSDIRLGTLGEPTIHPEFLDILEKIKPKMYITDGRIFGTPGDPRRIEYIDKTLESKSEIILKWSDTVYCKKAIKELKSSEIPFTICVKIGEEDLKLFWDKVWDEELKFILTPEIDINLIPEVTLKPEDLKNKENIKIMEYYKNILLTDKKIIITEDCINLKPIKIYDRI